MDFFEALWNDIMRQVGDPIYLGNNPITTLNIIVWSLFIGFVIGIGVTVYNKFVLGTMVRELIDRKAHTEESACTASEIGCGNVLFRFALRANGSFRKIIYMVGDTEYEKKERGFETGKFYLPEDNVHRAEVIYGKGGTSVMTILLSVLAFLLVVFVSFTVIPDLLQMLTNFIASIVPKSNIL